MGSLKYEISQHCKELIKAERIAAETARERIEQLESQQKNISTKLRKEARVPTDQSWRNYLHHTIKFGEWCKETYHSRHFEDCREHIGDYLKYLEAQGKTAHTIHTYLAGVCRVYEAPLQDIKDKPKRVIAETVRSRGEKAVDSRSDAKREASPRLYDFATRVGCRRREYGHLRKNDFVIDESGYPCVRIKRGKGGKYQEQRLLPEDVLFVQAYFNGSEDYMFTKRELANKIDLHHLRALKAQRSYDYYLKHLETEPGYRDQLLREVKARWAKYNKRTFKEEYCEGYYEVRGANRKLAEDLGRPIRYDKLAVMAVSIFHLSHWRVNVAITNYLLAY